MSDRIKRARTQSGLSQTVLGKKIGVSKGAISQWESGDVKNLRMANLFSMADATGFNARWIALGEGPERGAATPEEFEEKLAALSAEDIAALLRLAADQISGE